MKSIIISDIHIGNYKTYNPVPDFRLNQFVKLGNLISSITKEKNVSEIWVAGDLLQTAQSSPPVMAVVKTFLKTISENNIVRIVLGNHDVIVRSDKTDVSDYNNYTLVSLLDSLPNVRIYNDDVIDIENTSVHFHSWVPSNTFEYKKADYLVCHGDFDKSLSPFAGSFIDVSKYKRAFVGHIHIFREIGNGISLGTPLMHSFSDSPDVGILIYDFSNDSYERVSTKGMFLEFKYAETEEKAAELETETKEANKDAVIKVKPEKTDIIDVKTLSSLSIDPKNALKEFTAKLSDDSLAVLNSVVSKANEHESEVPDLRVHLHRIKAQNFLSIKNIDFDFRNYDGLTTVRGHVGAGKTTLFNLVEFMFLGKLYGYNKSDYTSVYPGKFSGEMTLEYKGSVYKIKRTLSSLEYTKDDKPQESNKKNDLQKCLETDLSFLRFWNLIYIKQSSTGIFSDMSDTNRVSFLSNLIGLSTIKAWTEMLAAEIKDLSNKNAEKSKTVTELNTKTEMLKMFNEQNREHSQFIDDSAVNQEIENCDKNIESCNLRTKKNNDSVIRLNGSISEFSGKMNANTEIARKINLKIDDIVSSTARIKSITAELKDIADRTPIIVGSDGYIEPVMPEFNVRMPEMPDTSDTDSKIAKLDTGIQTETVSLKVLNEKLTEMKNHPEICPTCKQPWCDEHLPEKIQALESQISEIEFKLGKYTAAKTKLAQIKDGVHKAYVAECSEYNNKKAAYDAELQKYRAVHNEYMRVTDLKSELVRVQDRIAADKTEIEELRKQFQECSYVIKDNRLELSNQILEGQIQDFRNQIQTLNTENESVISEIRKIEGNKNALLLRKGDIKRNNEIYETIQNNIKQISEYKVQADEILEIIGKTEETAAELSKFNSKVLSDKGLLVASLLQKVAEYLNSDKELKVETIEELQNGSLKPTLNIRLYVKEYGKYVDYAMLSGGQRLLADLRFLKGITNTIGSMAVIFMDETFKFFSTETVFEGIEIIKNMNVERVFLILHGSDNETLADKNITVTLTENGSRYQ